MPADQKKRTEQVIAAFKEQLGPLASEAVGDKGFADLAVIVQEALQQERAEVAAQFEALARALRATTETAEIEL